MIYFKDTDGKPWAYEDDVKDEQIKVGLISITEVEFNDITNPAPTQAEIDAAALAAKWTTIGEFWNKLTVTINGNKYKADETGTNRMALKRDALAADATTMWYEDWGSFSTNKVDLQDAITEADVRLQTFIDATMGAI